MDTASTTKQVNHALAYRVEIVENRKWLANGGRQAPDYHADISSCIFHPPPQVDQGHCDPDRDLHLGQRLAMAKRTMSTQEIWLYIADAR